MTLRIPLLCIASLGIVALLHGASQEQAKLTGTDLLAEFDRLAPINQAIHQGHWVVTDGDYPKTLGTFNSREVIEAFWCGDMCPSNGSVNIIYSNIKEDKCTPIGEPEYSFFWGPKYQGCTPLISRDGSLLYSSDGGLFHKESSWSIAYFPNIDCPVQAPLLFDDSSLCNKGAMRVSCRELHAGQRASIKATKSGCSLAVVKLDIEPAPGGH
jgi:hypothetical protein